MIFPQLGPEYYDEHDRDIKARMEAFYAEAITINQSFWAEADTDTRYFSGDQQLWNDLYGNLPVHQRRTFNFNRIRRVINMISGYQRRNRKSTIVTPVENSDAQTADQFTKIMFWLNQQEGVLETISSSFQGALITGMNFLHVWMDYRSDPISGNIRVDNCSYNSFLVDPYFRKHDLSDCNAIWKRSYLTKQETISLLPDKADEIMGLQSYQNNNKDGKFHFMPENYGYSYNNLLTYDEYYYRDYRTQKLLVDTQTGETLEWRFDDQDKLKQFLRLYPQVTVLEQEIPSVKLAILVQGKTLYHGPNPMGIDQYPFVPVLGYYQPEIPYYPWRIQGVVRGLRDAQYLYNRRRQIELDILESQINSGWIYKENALVNPKDVFLSGQGRGLALKEEAQMTDVQKIQPAQVPPSMIQLSELLAREVMEISGVNEELLGSASDDKAGVLSMLRQGAGLTTLQTLFDQLDYSQKLLGKLIIQLVQTNFTPGKVQRIIEQDPTEPFYSKAFGFYDAAVEEGLNTTTQRQMQFAQLLQLREVGVPIPNEVLLESATIQNKDKLTQAVQQASEQQQQMEQAQAQSTMQEQQARTELAQARAVADQGLGLERLSRIEENRALAVERVADAQESRANAQESRADAQQSRASAVLDYAKALRELDTLDLVNLEKLIRVAKALAVTKGEEDVITQERTKPSTTLGQPDGSGLG